MSRTLLIILAVLGVACAERGAAVRSAGHDLGVGPSVSLVKTFGLWTDSERHGAFRLLVAKGCSPEHCFDRAYLQWLEAVPGADDRYERTDVIHTERIRELGDRVVLHDVSPAPSAAAPGRFELIALNSHTGEWSRLCICPSGLGAYSARESACSSDPADAAMRSDVVEDKAQWETGWREGAWSLVEIREQDVDHFIPGLVYLWQRELGDGGREVRTDAFRESWKFYWAHEELYAGERLVARGPVVITPDGEPLFRIRGFLGGATESALLGEEILDHEILYYELDLYRNGEPYCRYRSDSNFLGNGRGDMRGLHRVPDDTVLVSGEGCPTVAELQANPFRDRLPRR